ncbi:hypothetical protein [Lelliottia sp. CFBP8978]|uniref:hypothetical protein n=1 Tax=Lelliottia sp. CFBP8978 TaxID=3096522 RepID=UPI002A6AA1EA|nr:hypothetical protein [Lelliottia sp. CFBP8978]MDY1036712.1 hypothetical protein [Lelliottia sp. CFBP8978]
MSSSAAFAATVNSDDVSMSYGDFQGQPITGVINGARNQANYATDEAHAAQLQAGENKSDIQILEKVVIAQDSAISTNTQNIDRNKSAIESVQDEVQTNRQNITQTQANVDALKADTANQFKSVNDASAQRAKIVDDKIADEAAARRAGDDNLQTQVTQNKADTDKSINAINDASAQRAKIVDRKIADETAARQAGDDNLQTQVTQNKADTDKSIDAINDASAQRAKIVDAELDQKVETSTYAADQAVQEQTDSAQDSSIDANAAKIRGDEMAQANRQRTAGEHVTPMNGAAGKDGKDADMTKVEANSKAVRANQTEISHVETLQAVQGDYIQHNAASVAHNSARIDHNSAAIQQNSRDIQRNRNDIEETREEMHQIGNNAAAMSSLHFNANADSWALSTGTAGHGGALAAGIQKNVTERAAMTFQASSSMDSGYMVGAGIHGDF